MSEFVQELSSDNFSVISASGVVLIDFWAPWCGPCKMMAPILERVGETLQGKAVIAKIDIDQEPHLAQQFRVQSVPTLILLKDGEMKKQWIGVQQAQVLVDAINSYL